MNFINNRESASSQNSFSNTNYMCFKDLSPFQSKENKLIQNTVCLKSNNNNQFANKIYNSQTDFNNSKNDNFNVYYRIESEVIGNKDNKVYRERRLEFFKNIEENQVVDSYNNNEQFHTTR